MTAIGAILRRRFNPFLLIVTAHQVHVTQQYCKSARFFAWFPLNWKAHFSHLRDRKVEYTRRIELRDLRRNVFYPESVPGIVGLNSLGLEARMLVK